MELFSFDGDYIRRLQERDAGTEAHFASYFGALLAMKFRRRLRSSSDVEDIRQEVFARVLARLKDIKDPLKLGSYVNSVANHVLFEHYRHEPRYEPFHKSFELIQWEPPPEDPDEHDVGGSILRIPIHRTFGAIITPSHELLPPVTDLVPRLELPAHFKSQLISAENVPLEVIRQVANNPRVMHEMSPRRFEEFIAGLIEELGFEDVLLTPLSYDGGRDIVARKTVHGIPITFFFECKKYAATNRVQLDTLRSLLGVVAHDSRSANIGVLVTTSRFTRGCKELIATDCRLDGKDYDGVMGWVSEWMRGSRFPG